MKPFPFIIRESYDKKEEEKKSGALINGNRYHCMDARFDGEMYEYAMASSDESHFLYMTQKNGERDAIIVKKFYETEDIARYWKLKSKKINHG